MHEHLHSSRHFFRRLSPHFFHLRVRTTFRSHNVCSRLLRSCAGAFVTHPQSQYIPLNPLGVEVPRWTTECLLSFAVCNKGLFRNLVSSIPCGFISLISLDQPKMAAIGIGDFVPSLAEIVASLSVFATSRNGYDPRQPYATTAGGATLKRPNIVPVYKCVRGEGLT